MPKHQAASYHAVDLEALLHQKGLDHLRVRRHGALLVLESGQHACPIPHARFRRVTRQWWRLEMPDHRGRWEPTPIRDDLDTLADLLIDQFPWALEPLENPEGTSGTSH